MTKINIAFCFNDSYTDKVAVTMTSLLMNHKNEEFNFYLFSSDLSEQNIEKLNKLQIKFKNFSLHPIKVDKSLFDGIKLNIDYISLETYYRYLIADLLPEVDKILYLDGDLIVQKEITSFYQTDLADCYLAGVSDLWAEKTGHKSDLGLKTYINAGVLLMNLKLMRADNLGQLLIEKTTLLWDKIKYQDQDILNVVCQEKILEVDDIYNFTMEHIKSDKSKAKKACIIHYTGQKKPWGDKKVRFKSLWQKYEKAMKKIVNKKIKVGLIVNEFFGGAGTPYGGYGALARKYIAKYIPDENIQIDVLLGRGKRKLFATKFHEDNVDLYKLPKRHFASRWWLKKQKYDVYLAIELTSDWVLRHEPNPNTKLLLWIQDPRPWYEWREIETMTLMPEPNYYNQKIYDTVNKWYKDNRIKFISQANSLNDKAKDLYRLKNSLSIPHVPNPIDIDKDFNLNNYLKKDKIIFLGRLEDVKRGWLFCEIAKKMPEYEFYVLGKINTEKEKTASFWEKYKNIKNLHFAGHVDGKEKENHLKEAKILVNTSIHEALPVSFLEALSYGVCLVSNRNPDFLTEKFGIWTGQINGDGFDKVDLYVNAVKKLMTDNALRQTLAENGRKYVEEVHNINKIKKDIKKFLIQLFEIGV